MPKKIKMWQSVSHSNHQVFARNNRWNILSLAFSLLLNGLLLSSTLGQTVVDSISRPGLAPAALAVYEKGNKLCVFDDRTNHLLIYDEGSFALLKEIVFESTINDPFSCLGMIVDENKDELYVEIAMSGVSIAIVDLINLNVKNYITTLGGLPQAADGLKYDETLGKLYTFFWPSDLFAIDVNTKTVVKIALPGIGPKTDLNVNPITHEVFLANAYGSENKLNIINGTTYNVTQIDAPVAFSMTVNWKENKVYIIQAMPYQTWIYDRDTGEEKWIYPTNDAEQLYYNPGGDKVYSNIELSCISTIISGGDDSYFNLPLKGGTYAMGFRYETRHTYFVQYNFIGVYDETSQMFEKIEFNNPHRNDWGGTQLIAVNQITGRIYISHVQFYDTPDYNPIWIIQDTEKFSRPNILLCAENSPVEILDPNSHNLVELLGVDYDLRGVSFRPDGGRIYFTVDQLGTGKFEVHAGSGAWDKRGIDAGNFNALVGSLNLGNVDPKGIMPSPNQPLVYVACSAINKVKIINVSIDTLLSVIKDLDVGTNPTSGSITSEGYYGFVTNKGSNNVTVFNAQSNTVIGTIPVGTAPLGIAINPGSRFAYIANSGSNNVSVIDVNSKSVMNTINVGTTPYNIVFSPDGKYAFVTNNGDGTVSVINAGTHTVINTITVDPHPDGICVYPDGSRIYVATDSVANIIHLPDLSVSQVNYNSAYGQKKTIVSVADPTSRFSGQIIDANGIAIPNSVVKVIQEGIEKGSAIANASGDYCIYNLQNGMYDLEFSGPDFLTQSLTSQSINTGQTKIINFTAPTSVNIPEASSNRFFLHQNYPNPFYQSTTISFSISSNSFVSLRLFDSFGREVLILLSEELPAGTYLKNWNATGMHGGVYFYQLRAGSFIENKKLILLK